MVWFVQDGVVRKEVGDNVEEFWENIGPCVSCTPAPSYEVYHVLIRRETLRSKGVTYPAVAVTPIAKVSALLLLPLPSP